MMECHDAKPGVLDHCQLTGSHDIFCALDLGAQPLCDTLLSSPNEPEVHYPLSLNICPSSGSAQLGYVVEGDKVYPPMYPYRSGISKPLADYQRAFAAGVVSRGFTTDRPRPFVVDVGSNDGTLLTGFMEQGCTVLGIEPTNVAQIARDENGVTTWQEFFTERTARDIGRRADIITMTNVFAHMAGLGEVMRGICALLADCGVFITESHYLLDVLHGNQFDTIYHEHVRTYSLKALCTLAGMYGLEVFDVERGSRYGGNIRAYIARVGKYPVAPRVRDTLLREEHEKLHEPETWALFRSRVMEQRDHMMEWLYSVHRAGVTVAACSAPGRASTLTNYYGMRFDTVAYTGELHNSLKLGKYMPGSRIPIVHNRRLVEEQPTFIILFAWHYADVIAARLRSEGVRSRLIQPLPTFHEV